MVEGDYVQSSPPPSNDWHYVSIRAQSGSENLFSWKNKAGVDWGLIFVEEVSNGVFKFQVGKTNFQLGGTLCFLDTGGGKLSLQH